MADRITNPKAWVDTGEPAAVSSTDPSTPTLDGAGPAVPGASDGTETAEPVGEGAPADDAAAAVIVAWVDNQLARAQLALDREQARTRPRVGLSEALAQIIATHTVGPADPGAPDGTSGG